MKQSISGLMDRYRCADGNTRLHLYLQYPELRTEFYRNRSKRPLPETGGSHAQRQMHLNGSEKQLFRRNGRA